MEGEGEGVEERRRGGKQECTLHYNVMLHVYLLE